MDAACGFARFLVAGRDREEEGECGRSSKALIRYDSDQLRGNNARKENGYEKAFESYDSRT